MFAFFTLCVKGHDEISPKILPAHLLRPLELTQLVIDSPTKLFLQIHFCLLVQVVHKCDKKICSKQKHVNYHIIICYLHVVPLMSLLNFVLVPN